MSVRRTHEVSIATGHDLVGVLKLVGRSEYHLQDLLYRRTCCGVSGLCSAGNPVSTIPEGVLNDPIQSLCLRRGRQGLDSYRNPHSIVYKGGP